METLKSGAGALGIDLSITQLAAFEIYFRELIDWNKKINLTSITDYEEVQEKHFLDSLTAVSAIDLHNTDKTLNALDIGTGAGFPGIPLKIVFPGMRLALLEATGKKTKFLQHLVGELGLKDVEIITGRAEEIAHNTRYREKYDVVLARAVAELPALAELALPFCSLGGLFIAYKKGDIREEMEKSHKAIDLMGGRLKETMPVSPELFNDNRCLVIIRKIKNTPAEYPRRPGMPEKRPVL